MIHMGTYRSQRIVDEKTLASAADKKIKATKSTALLSSHLSASPILCPCRVLPRPNMNLIGGFDQPTAFFFGAVEALAQS